MVFIKVYLYKNTNLVIFHGMKIPKDKLISVLAQFNPGGGARLLQWHSVN